MKGKKIMYKVLEFASKLSEKGKEVSTKANNTLSASLSIVLMIAFLSILFSALWQFIIRKKAAQKKNVKFKDHWKDFFLTWGIALIILTGFSFGLSFIVSKETDEVIKANWASLSAINYFIPNVDVAPGAWIGFGIQVVNMILQLIPMCFLFYNVFRLLIKSKQLLKEKGNMKKGEAVKQVLGDLAPAFIFTIMYLVGTSMFTQVPKLVFNVGSGSNWALVISNMFVTIKPIADTFALGFQIFGN